MFTKYIIFVAGLHNNIEPFVHALEQPVAKRLPGWGGSKHQSSRAEYNKIINLGVVAYEDSNVVGLRFWRDLSKKKLAQFKKPPSICADLFFDWYTTLRY